MQDYESAGSRPGHNLNGTSHDDHREPSVVDELDFAECTFGNGKESLAPETRLVGSLSLIISQLEPSTASMRIISRAGRVLMF